MTNLQDGRKRVTRMIREDVLLALKEAEDKRDRLIQEAKQKSKANIEKARREAALKVEKGKARSAELRETLLEAKIQGIEDDARVIRERGKKKAQRLKTMAMGNMENAVMTLMAEFERELDV